MAAAGHLQEAARRARYKLLCSILTNFGFALTGVSLIQLYFAAASSPITTGRMAGFMGGLAMQALALYLVPRGETP